MTTEILLAAIDDRAFVPTLFEVSIVDQINAMARPALRHIFQAIAERYELGVLMENSEVLYACLAAFIESNSLLSAGFAGGSVVERFCGLRRVSTVTLTDSSAPVRIWVALAESVRSSYLYSLLTRSLHSSLGFGNIAHQHNAISSIAGDSNNARNNSTDTSSYYALSMRQRVLSIAYILLAPRIATALHSYFAAVRARRALRRHFWRERQQRRQQQRGDSAPHTPLSPISHPRAHSHTARYESEASEDRDAQGRIGTNFREAWQTRGLRSSAGDRIRGQCPTVWRTVGEDPMDDNEGSSDSSSSDGDASDDFDSNRLSASTLRNGGRGIGPRRSRASVEMQDSNENEGSDVATMTSQSSRDISVSSVGSSTAASILTWVRNLVFIENPASSEAPLASSTPFSRDFRTPQGGVAIEQEGAEGNQEVEEQGEQISLTEACVEALAMTFPVLSAACEGAVVLNRLLYTLSIVPFHHPLFGLLDMALVKQSHLARLAATNGAPLSSSAGQYTAAASGVTREASATRASANADVSTGTSAGRVAGEGMSGSTVMVGVVVAVALSLRAAEWVINSSGEIDEYSLKTRLRRPVPPPPAPPAPVLLPGVAERIAHSYLSTTDCDRPGPAPESAVDADADGNVELKAHPAECCPLCGLERRTPCATTSGYVFCYLCILPVVRETQRCPLTGWACTERNLIRLFEQF